MVADSFSKLRFIELCLIFFRSVYPMACKNDVIVLTHLDPIFETKHRLTLRGLLYAPHCIHYQRGNERSVGTRMSRHAKGKLVAWHLFAHKIKKFT